MGPFEKYTTLWFAQNSDFIIFHVEVKSCDFWIFVRGPAPGFIWVMCGHIWVLNSDFGFSWQVCHIMIFSKFRFNYFPCKVKSCHFSRFVQWPALGFIWVIYGHIPVLSFEFGFNWEVRPIMILSKLRLNYFPCKSEKLWFFKIHSMTSPRLHMGYV